MTKRSCNTIIMAKMLNTIPGPILLKRKGMEEGIIAAKTQCTELPKLCP
jgi:hypothetical protein